MSLAAMAGVMACVSACAPQSRSFDPNDPAVLAVIDSLMQVTVEASRRVDPVGVMAAMGTGEDFTLVTGDVMLRGSDAVAAAMAETYSGLQSQYSTVSQSYARLLSPDVAVFSAVSIPFVPEPPPLPILFRIDRTKFVRSSAYHKPRRQK